MKNIQHSLIIIAIFALTLTGCENNRYPKKILVNSSQPIVGQFFKSPKQITMTIEGMVCAVGCAATIEKNLNKTNGIKLAKVDFETKKAVLTFDAELLSTNDIAQVIFNTSSDYLVTDLDLIY
jgi:Cu+-exporting ATPase